MLCGILGQQEETTRPHRTVRLLFLVFENKAITLQKYLTDISLVQTSSTIYLF